MKTYLKRYSVLFLLFFFIGLFVLKMEPLQFLMPCCLCNSSRYHAPCIIDLKTGTITELSIYDPHPTIMGELSEIQYTTGTFSLILCCEAQGYKNTTDKMIKLQIPAEVLENKPKLCVACAELLPEGYSGRYILADLYAYEDRRLIQIEQDDVYQTRCYSIVVVTDFKNIDVTIQGLISSEQQNWGWNH